MKKIASLVLTVVLLATMLTVFAVPASAAKGTDYVGKWLKTENANSPIMKDNREYYLYAISKDDILGYSVPCI